MLRYRLIFGVIMIAALLAVFYFDHRLDQLDIHHLFPWRDHPPAGLIMLALFLVLIPIAAWELCRIFQAKGIHANLIMVSAAGITGCLLMYAIPWQLRMQTSIAIFASVITLVFLVSIVVYSFPNRTQGVVAAVGVTMFALIYLGLLPGFFLATRRWHSPWVIAAVIFITKSCDIGAYFTGRAFGKHKLIPWLSPKKTIEGLAGGVVLSSLLALALAALFNHYGWAGYYDAHRQFIPRHYPLPIAALAGAAFGLIGHAGDLIASLFKRDAGFKDSSSSIPGFGGIIDVIDSPLVVAPVAYWLLALMHTAGN